MLLFLRSLFWTIVFPGVVTIYIPSLILKPADVPATWSFPQWIAIVPGLIGVSVLAYSIVSFAVTGRGTLSPVDAPQRLVVKGMYRYVRNPMYCGVMVTLLAETLFFVSESMLVYSVLWFLFAHTFVLFCEEPALRRKFGNSYEIYCRSVHRWLPGKPFQDAGDAG